MDSGLISVISEPYIRYGLVEQFFSDKSTTDYVLRTYFNAYGWDRFEFKFEYNTERKILNMIDQLPEDTPDATTWKRKLQVGF